MAAEGVDKFLEYVRDVFPDTCSSHDLLKLSRRPHIAQPHPLADCSTGKVCVLIDGECCLDRLYGGYYSDWACGGQWNRVLDFLPLLASNARNHNVSLVVVFDGSLNHDRDVEWKRQQMDFTERSKQIMQHIRRRRTPPPKSLWIPPTGLRSFLRLALTQIGVTVFQTVDDHKQEVMTFLRDNGFDVLLAEGAEYLFMDPPRFMFASSLKLTFKGRLDVREIALDDVCRKIDLHPNRLALVAALLGNFLVSQKDLKPLHDELMVLAPADQKTNYRSLVPAIVTFVRNLPSVDDVKTIGEFIFSKLPEKERTDKTERFVRSVNYYLNATKESFHKFKKHNSILRTATGAQKKFASDVSSEAKTKNLPEDVNSLENCLDGVHIEDPTPPAKANGAGEDTAEHGSSGDSSRSTSPLNNNNNDALSDAVTAAQTAASAPCQPAAEHFVPVVPPQIVKVVMHRHCKALMHPWIHQALTKAEIRIASGVEETEGPVSAEIWKGVRQAVYGVLFDLNHKAFLLRQQKLRKPTPPDAAGDHKPSGKYPQELSTSILVKEWSVEGKRRDSGDSPKLVQALPIAWRGVPTVKQLWFRQDYGPKRIKAFLSCMLSDTPLMMNPACVPQKALIMCCVLRYLVAYRETRLLQRHELDAFLATAVSPQLIDANTMQEIPVQNLTPRGVTLARWFMAGVEHAMVANDACGSPIPPARCCPWLFFDGKLFQLKLNAAALRKQSLLELCNGEREQVALVERMRMAVLEGLEWIFAAPAAPLPTTVSDVRNNERLDAVFKGRGLIGRREILETGGQLAIAGKVVGRWGGQHTNRGGATQAQQVRQSAKSRTPTSALQTRPTSTQIRPPPPPVASTAMRPHQVSLMHPRGSMTLGGMTNRRMPMGAPPPPPPMPPVYRPVPPMVPAPPYGSFPMMTRGPVGHVPSMDALQQYQASVAGRPSQSMQQQVHQRSRGGGMTGGRGGGATHSPRAAPSANMFGGRGQQNHHAPNRPQEQNVVRQTRLSGPPPTMTTRLTATAQAPASLGLWHK